MGKSNLNQAMYEMFGVGKDPNAESEPVAAKEESIDKLDILAVERRRMWHLPL